jgi:hypothetical protein
MTTARLHRYLFLMMAAAIALLVQLGYTTHRLNRMEAAVAEVDRLALDALETAKEIRAEVRSR